MPSPTLIRLLTILFAILGLGASASAAALFDSPATDQNTTRVSVDSAGVQGNSLSGWASISADGRYVAFESEATNLVPGDTNGRQDIFVHDRQTGQTSSVSAQGNEASFSPSISADGRYVAFNSDSNNLVPGDTNLSEDIFVNDRQTGQMSRVSVDSAGMQVSGESDHPSISADGRFVAFISSAGNLVPGDTNGSRDVFVHDRQTGQTSRVSVDSSGVQGNGDSHYPSISADGLYVAFMSHATNLAPGDTNGSPDVIVHDRQTGQTSRVSVDSAGVQGNNWSYYPSISADGRYVAFMSSATNLVPGDTNDSRDVFVRDRQTSQTSRVSVGSLGVQGDGYSSDPSISADGRYVALYSYATNLVPGDTNGCWDSFVHDRQTGQTVRVSVGSAGIQGNSNSYYPSISADGRYVAFHSDATNLVSGDTNGFRDVFVHDRGASGPSLAKIGTCPGAITLTISNATAGGLIALLSGPAGNFVQQSLPCQGLVLVISPPTLRALFSANGSGAVVLNFNAPAGACGLSVQAVDITSCAATNAIVL